MRPDATSSTSARACIESGNLILDLFLGSGSTLIAAEKTNRKCYGMELDPKYCDVIVKRWEDFTGKKASKQCMISLQKIKKPIQRMISKEQNMILKRRVEQGDIYDEHEISNMK